MADDFPSLDELRAEIDRMDTQIHDLLMDRIAITDQIAAYKNRYAPDAAKMRPGREAVIMRKLVERHNGALSPQVLVRIWREIMSAVVHMQEPFSVVVAADDDAVAYWDLARFHYGTQPHRLAPNAFDVITQCRADKTVIGIVPAPADGEANPWWPHLAAEGTKVFGRLPFLDRGEGGTVAFTVGQVPLESSGDDLTWLALEARGDISRGRIADWRQKAGLTGNTLAATSGRNSGSRHYLVELNGYLTADDPALASLRAIAGEELSHLAIVGVFARPLSIDGD